MTQQLDHGTASDKLRPDLKLIADQLDSHCTLLDVGCADGTLLQWLFKHKNIDGRGIELEVANVQSCVEKGLFVVQGDADTDLNDYGDDSFDYVVLSRTLQAVHRPRDVLSNLLRIGNKAVVTIPNFGFWRVRLSLALSGRMPMTSHLSKMWYETDNIHFCTIRDMFDLIALDGYHLERFVPVSQSGKPLNHGPKRANLLASQALFILSK